MKLINIIFLFIFTILIVATATYIIQDYVVPKEIKTLDFDFYVTSSNEIGFNLDKDKMHFGNLCNNCRSERKVIFTNYHNYREKIVFFIVSKDSITSWFTIYPNNDWNLNASEQLEFKIEVNPPEEAKIGFYSGQILIKTYKSWPWEKNVPKPLLLKGYFSPDPTIFFFYGLNKQKKVY